MTDGNSAEIVWRSGATVNHLQLAAVVSAVDRSLWKLDRFDQLSDSTRSLVKAVESDCFDRFQGRSKQVYSPIETNDTLCDVLVKLQFLLGSSQAIMGPDDFEDQKRASQPVSVGFRPTESMPQA